MKVSTVIIVLTICSFVADVAAIQCWKCNDGFGTVKDTGELVINSNCIHGISEETCADGEVCVTFDMTGTGKTMMAAYYDKKIENHSLVRLCGPREDANENTLCEGYKETVVRSYIAGQVDDSTFKCERKACETDLCNNEGNANLATAAEGEDGADGSGDEEDKKDSYSSGGQMAASVLLVLATFVVFCNII